MQIDFSPAKAGDEDQLIALMRSFYEHEHIAFVESVARDMLKHLSARPSFGEVHLIKANAQMAGYVITTLGFSVEFGGRYTVLDELFVLEPFRGKGLGRASLQFVEDRCRQQGIQTLRLEVNHDNLRAREVYGRGGYYDQERHLLTKRLIVGLLLLFGCFGRPARADIATSLTGTATVAAADMDGDGAGDVLLDTNTVVTSRFYRIQVEVP